tara:strand:- start:1771 stop:3801 length:2031 start_codon:yes stop_codon:yes gene_type:complete
MIINSIKIKNFQTYFANIEFEFDQPSHEKNVVLIGGLNGAGKTSFFSSIVLGLFGKNAEGIIFERSSGENIDDSYHTYLQEVFSNEAKKANDIEMEIALSITHEETNIKIVRKWWFDSSIDEILEIYTEKDGTVIPLEIPEEDVERNEYYEAYIQSIIPSQVGRFFFFDGEEIKAIAKQDPEQAVINGINALLGFDVLEQLVVDLETLKRNLRKELPGAANSGLLKNYEELEKLESTLSSAEEEKKYCTEDIDGMNIHLEELEKDISEAFKGRDVDNRNEILDKIFNLDKELSAVENELQTLVGEVLTLALPSELITETEKKLSKEINTLKQQDQSAVINSLKNKFNKQLIKNLPKEIKDKEKIIKDAASLTWEEMNNSLSGKASIMSNYFSDDEIKVAFNHIQEVKATTNREIARLVGKQDALLKEKSELLSMQQLFDSGRYAQDILDKKSNTLNQLSTKQHELERVEAEIMVLNQEITNIKNTIDRLESSLEISKDIQKELEEVESYQSLIKEFMNEARGRRANLLSKKTSDVIKKLAHKEDLISKVKIDEKTYSINLLDSKNNKVSRMSAGESEIFALSLLQALGEVSNRKLPVVIDTPLGRLDYSHRQSIVTNYFHNVSEQVFILSTDTEIDHSLFNELRPYVSQTFLIKSNKDKSSTVYPDQYFEFSKVKK